MLARRLGPLMILLAAVALAGALAQPVTVLRAVTRDGDVLVCRTIGAGDPVTLVFTHSMYGGEVRETWRVADGGLARDRIVTEREAAAEYYATDGAVEWAEDGFVVVSPPLEVEALTVRVDGIGRHRLRFEGGDEMSLAGRVDGSEAVIIEVRQHTILQQLIAGCEADTDSG